MESPGVASQCHNKIARISSWTQAELRAEPFDKLRTAPFDKLRTALVEARRVPFDRLKAQGDQDTVWWMRPLSSASRPP